MWWIDYTKQKPPATGRYFATFELADGGKIIQVATYDSSLDRWMTVGKVTSWMPIPGSKEAYYGMD